MTSFLKSTHYFLAIVCVYFALTASPLTHSQTASATAQDEQSSQSYPPYFSPYIGFIGQVGREDYGVKRAAKEGKGQIPAKKDYAAEIGIDRFVEQKMRDILVAVFNKENEVTLQEAEWRNDLMRKAANSDEAEKRLSDEEGTLLTRKQIAAVIAARTGLESGLDQETFNKIDKYILSNKWDVKQPLDAKSCPSMSKPVRPPMPPGWDNIAYPGAYGEYFDQIGQTDEDNREAVASGEATSGFPSPILLPEGVKQAVIAIALEASHQFKENDKQLLLAERIFARQNIEKYGDLAARKIPDPPEIEAMRVKDETIAIEYAGRLKLALGEYFTDFDVALSRNLEHYFATQTCDSVPKPK
jgi:hypothetical protein